MKEIMKARKQATPANPPARLEPREDDYDLPPVLYMACSVFAELKQKPSTDKFPGTLVLRQYEPGEVICRQGDPGWTAFALLTDEDVVALHRERERLLEKLPTDIKKAEDNKKEEEAEKARSLLVALQNGRMPPPPQTILSPTAVASVYLDSSPTTDRPQGFFARLFGSRSRQARRSSPRYIQVDAPVSLDYGTRKAYLDGGKIFGDWSCIYGTPRSATVVANRRCYVLEMLRNVLDKILGDDNFREKKDREYTEEILNNHLAGLSIFADLTTEQLREVRQSVKLQRYRDGEVIFDKGDPPESMYIVRRGLVKVLLNEWPLLSVADVHNWRALADALTGENATDAQRFLSSKIDVETRSLLARADLSAEDREKVIAEINRLLKDPHFTTVENPKTHKQDPSPALQALLNAAAFKEMLAAELPEKPDFWSDQDRRRYNRLVFESACPGAMRPQAGKLTGSENILTYHTRGDFFGEMGVMLDQPRSATCVAYVHPRPEADEVDPQGDKWRREEERIELVEIPGAVLKQLCQQYPPINAKVQAEIKFRQERSRRHQTRRSRQETSLPYQSDAFQQLGLIQGQKLMLIDLDHCTRCDECVQACVHTHSDGRSRLFLDGPRFGRYLVPVSCRACRDPVCMIGCPVGSIRRGDNLEIIIEDWCTGCQLCSKNCPYGSIQMHDLGIVPEDGTGWKFRPAVQVPGDDWTKLRFNDRNWFDGTSPIIWDQDLEETFRLAMGWKIPDSLTLSFRYQFHLDGELFSRSRGVKLVLDSAAQEIQVEGTGRQAKVVRFLPVWLNGQPIPAESWKVEQKQYAVEIADEKRQLLHAGRNILAVQATPVAGKRALLLQVAIDEIRPSGAVLPLRAVVCDQCSSLPDQMPACVHACPHDAAMRVDAWTEFPTR